MLTIQEALKLDLSDNLKEELSKYPMDYIVAMDQNNSLHLIPNTEDNLKVLKREPHKVNSDE